MVRRDVDGAELGTVDLEPTVFGIEPNQAVLHQVVTAQLAAARAGTQSTRTRAEVRGGGAKPYRQKGTGRARQGSTRSPQWSGGGVALGPQAPQLPPADPQEDGPPGAVLGPVGPGRRGPGRAGRRWALGGAQDQGRRGRARGPRARRPGAGGAGRRRRGGRRSFANLPARPDHRRSASCRAYDVLRNDWVVFTDETLPGAEATGLIDEDPSTADTGRRAAKKAVEAPATRP